MHWTLDIHLDQMAQQKSTTNLHRWTGRWSLILNEPKCNRPSMCKSCSGFWWFSRDNGEINWNPVLVVEAVLLARPRKLLPHGEAKKRSKPIEIHRDDKRTPEMLMYDTWILQGSWSFLSSACNIAESEWKPVPLLTPIVFTVWTKTTFGWIICHVNQSHG